MKMGRRLRCSSVTSRTIFTLAESRASEECKNGAGCAQYRNRVGPFATWGRANEVMNYYRQMGYYTTQAFHSGDGYYFDVWTGGDEDNG
jgi:hypothetical protein